MNAQHTLDYLAATAAQKIVGVIGEKVKNGKEVEAREVENLVTKALGVLQSQGVYAMALFLFSRSSQKTQAKEMKAEERVAAQILAWLRSLQDPKGALKNVNNLRSKPEQPVKINDEGEKRTALQEFADLSKDLDKLLLVRDLYEQTLIYSRYHAKAASD